MGIVIDDRLPPVMEIDEPIRQQKRRIERRPTICWRCGDLLTADDLCFAEGKDTHRTCAESFNHEMFLGLEILLKQDADAEAMVAAERKDIDRESRGLLASY